KFPGVPRSLAGSKPRRARSFSSKKGLSAIRKSVQVAGCRLPVAGNRKPATGNRYTSCPAMGVSGNLKTMLPGDLLQWLSLGQKTGTLVVSNKAVEKKIFFKNGRVISSASNDPREYLGQFLMSHGYMSEPELMKGMQVQAETGILLGKILV